MTEARNDTPGDSSWPPAHPSIPDRDSATSASPGTPDPILGAIVNEKYRIVALLATGGMGRVYSAEQLSLGRMVAVKVLFPVLAAGDPNATGTLFRRRFLREASVLAKLQHPNIVTVFDYGRIETPTSDRERFFIAMELLEGETLQDRLNRGPLREPEALEFLRQTARGLRAAHDRGIVHRDLKPSNLMIANAKEGDSALKLLDFGVTKVLGEKNQELTDEGAVIGSPRFMSPEQVGGVVDARTDIYSLGIIAFTMLTGRPPFMGETSMLTMMAHLNTPLPSLVVSRPDLGVSEWLDEIIQQCCEKDPGRSLPVGAGAARRAQPDRRGRERQNGCGFEGVGSIHLDRASGPRRSPAGPWRHANGQHHPSDARDAFAGAVADGRRPRGDGCCSIPGVGPDAEASACPSAGAGRANGRPATSPSPPRPPT